MICVILQLIVDLIWTTHRKFFWKHFTFWHKINQSNANVSTHYWLICLYSTNICYDIFAASEIFNFIWNIFNSKALKACYIITIHMQSHLMICTHEGLLHNFFFLSGFYSQTLTIHMTAGDRRGPSFIPFCRFYPLTKIETFICEFACDMTITYF